MMIDLCYSIDDFARKAAGISKPLLLLILPILLYACSPKAGDLPALVLHPHEEIPAGADEKDYTSVFLAGTIDMGAAEDWQAIAAELLQARGGNWLIYNPRQEEWHPEREGEMDYQVNWELDHLERADYILMNFLPGSQSPITLLELGLFAGTGKLRVICPESFYRYDNVRITCQRYSVPLFGSLEEAIDSL